MTLRILDHTAAMAATPLAACAHEAPWAFTAAIEQHVRAAIAALAGDEWQLDGDVAVHRSARIAAGAQLHAPVLVGPRAFVAAGARIGANAVLAPGTVLASRSVVARLALVDQE